MKIMKPSFPNKPKFTPDELKEDPIAAISAAESPDDAIVIRELTAKWIEEDCWLWQHSKLESYIGRNLHRIRPHNGLANESYFVNAYGLVRATYDTEDPRSVEPKEPHIPCFVRFAGGEERYVARVDVGFDPPEDQVELFAQALASIDQLTDNFFDTDPIESPRYLAVGCNVLAFHLAKSWELSGAAFPDGASVGALILAAYEERGIVIATDDAGRLDRSWDVTEPHEGDEIVKSESPFAFVPRRWMERPDLWGMVDISEDRPEHFGPPDCEQRINEYRESRSKARMLAKRQERVSKANPETVKKIKNSFLKISSASLSGGRWSMTKWAIELKKFLGFEISAYDAEAAAIEMGMLDGNTLVVPYDFGHTMSRDE